MPAHFGEQVQGKVGHGRAAAQERARPLGVHALDALLRRVEDDRVDRGLSQEISRIGGEDERLVPLVGEMEGTAPHRILPERMVSLDALARHDRGLVERQRAEEGAVGAAEPHLEAVAVQGADSADGLRLSRDELRHTDDRVEIPGGETVRAIRLPEEPGEAVHEIVRFHLPAVVESDAPVKLELVHHAVARDRPAFRDLRNRLEVRGEADERTEDLGDHDRGVGVRGQRGIERAEGLAVVAKDLGPSGPKIRRNVRVGAGRRIGGARREPEESRRRHGAHDEQDESRRDDDGAQLGIESQLLSGHPDPPLPRGAGPVSASQGRQIRYTPTDVSIGGLRGIYRRREVGT